MACYNLTIDEDDDPCNINIPKSEGHCEEILSGVEARISVETSAMMCRRLWTKFCHGSKIEVLSKLVSGCVKGLYCVEGPYCGEAEVSGCAEEERCVKA